MKSEWQKQIENLKTRGLSDTQIQRRIYSQLNNVQKMSMINESILKHNYGTLITYNNSKYNNFQNFGDLYLNICQLRHGIKS